MDPWLTGLAAIFGAQNPSAGAALDMSGIPPPVGLGGPQPDEGLGNWITTVNPEPQTVPGADAAKPNNAQLMQLAAMQGVKAPAPVTPIMSGGVAGGVKPPQVNENIAKQGNPAITALMQALLAGRGGAPAVPSLGALVRGRGQ